MRYILPFNVSHENIRNASYGYLPQWSIHFISDPPAATSYSKVRVRKVHTVECQEFVRWMEPLIITGGVSRNWIIVISLALLEYAVSSRLSLPACRLFTNFLFKKRLDAVVVDISDTFHFFEPHYSLLTPHHGVFNLLTSVLQMAKEMAWFPGKSS